MLGGQDERALSECAATGLLPQLFDIAQSHNLLPALAVRYGEHRTGREALNGSGGELLVQALRDNTMRNMQISAQALKFTRLLNRAGIVPLFLKGTAQLLTAQGKNLGFRKQVDIDLLVKPNQLAAAGEVFLADGYSFCRIPVNSTEQTVVLQETAKALKTSTAHHHLPPLAKVGYAATVELHRHFLPRRFQRNNPLRPLFSAAEKHESHSASFLVPSPEYRIMHMIMGTLVHDGYLARYAFPVREACDYMDLIEHSGERFDYGLVARHCGKNFNTFSQLVNELMASPPAETINGTVAISQRLRIMQKRYNSAAVGRALDAYARAIHLANSLAHSPAKLPGYVKRLVSTG